VGEHSACHLLPRWFAELFFDPEDGGYMFLRNVRYNYRLHGVISQKMILFITTAVKTSNPTYTYMSVMSENS
jgi:hypothetical protein